MTAPTTERPGRIPVIKFWGVLLVPLQGDVMDSQVSELVHDVLGEIRRGGAMGVVLDLSGLWMVDSHLCAAFADLSASARYMGVRTVLCGLSPDIALTLESMAITLAGVKTTLTLEHALAALGLRPATTRTAKQTRATARSLADEMLTRNPPASTGGPDTPAREGG